MDKTELGQTGLKVSRLGLGTVKFGRNEGVKYPSSFDLPDEDHLADILAIAKDLGMNVLDTAPSYGHSEERLGRLLKHQRKDWVIIGKAGEEFSNGQSTYNFTPIYFEQSLHRTLKSLKTDYLDVFLMHSDGQDIQNLSPELIDAMNIFKKQGLVRSIGASTKTVEGGLKTLEFMDVAMVTYHPHHTDEKPVLDAALEKKKGIFLKKVLNSGHSLSPEDSIRFALSHPAVSSAIIGTINPLNLRQNARFTAKA